MHYDPVKDVFASAIKRFPFTRKIFYKTLDVIFLRSWYVRRELKNLKKQFGEKEISIFDAGTGYGQYSYFMKNHLLPNSIYAVDVKENWINDCREFFNGNNISNISFAVEDLTEIQHENKFDLIVCVDVMEHIQDDVKVFSNFFRALKKGGFMLMNTPSIFGGSDVHDDEDESFIGEHARQGYSFEDLKAKLEPIGFSVHLSKYTYGFWGDKAWRLGIKYPMQLLNFSKLFFILLPFYYLLTFPFTLLMMYGDFLSKNSVGSGILFIAKK
ncbi:MAG: class I SAM-dependent methyltransferase [Ignavibacteria bacterium]|nr:class I SAM-dependent methyltransferase [Ignavibacteria bacterium]